MRLQQAIEAVERVCCQRYLQLHANKAPGQREGDEQAEGCGSQKEYVLVLRGSVGHCVVACHRGFTVVEWADYQSCAYGCPSPVNGVEPKSP